MKHIMRWGLVTLLLLLCGLPALASTDRDDFGDLSDTELAAVAALSDMGIIEGFPDGNFHLEASLTRAEFAKMLCMFAAQDQLTEAEATFADVAAEAWYSGWVARAVQQGWVSGYPGNEYRPQKDISQQELAAVLLRLSGTDTTGFAWPGEYIAMAEKTGLLGGVSFNATAPASRLIACRMFYNLLPQQETAEEPDEEAVTEPETEDAAVADGLYLGVVENTHTSDTGREITFYYTEQSLPVVTSLRRLPTAGTFIYYTVEQGSIASWHLLLDAVNESISASSPLTRTAVPDGPYTWAARQTGREVESPVSLSSAKPLIQYISYRNLTVGQSRTDSFNYWLRDDTLFFEINGDGQIQPGSRDSLELGQAVVILADKEGEARFVFCFQ